VFLTPPPYTCGCTGEIVRYNRYRAALKGFYFYFIFSSELMVDGISVSFFTATFLFHPRTNVSEIIVFFSTRIRQTLRRKHTHRRAAYNMYNILYAWRLPDKGCNNIIGISWNAYTPIYLYILVHGRRNRTMTYINRATCCRDSNNWRKSYYYGVLCNT